MRKSQYKRIGSGARLGLTSSFATRSSVWMGPDHLLLVNLDYYTEHYRRFYFRDIQTVVIRKDKRQRNINIFFGFFFGLFAGFVIIASDNVARWVLGCWAALMMVPILYNSLRGPTCVTHIRTATQFMEVQGLRRLRKANKTLERIREFVQGEQPLLAQEDIRHLLATAGPHRAASAAPPGPPPLMAAEDLEATPALDLPPPPVESSQSSPTPPPPALG